MKKALFSGLLIVAFGLCLCGCVSEEKRISGAINKESTFELSFLEDVSDKDLSSLFHEVGWFGAESYYNSGYKEGDEYYVHYLVTAYPDYADGGHVVTYIKCTDPKAIFFGDCTINNCNSLFDYLSSKGFEVLCSDNDSPEGPSTTTTAKKGNVEIFHSLNKEITFRYDVENRDGIVF